MSDFLTRMVDRAMGRSQAVKPIVAPLFAPGSEMAVKSPFEKTEPVLANISTGSKALEEHVTTIEKNLDPRPGTVKSDAETNELKTARLTAQSIPGGNTQKQDTIKPASLATRQRKEGHLSPIEFEPQDANRVESGRRVYSQKFSFTASKNSGVIPTDVQERSESSMTPIPHRSLDAFMTALFFVQQRGQQHSDQLLIEEPGTSSKHTKTCHNGEAYVSSERATSSVSSSEVIRPRVVMRREKSGSSLADEKSPVSETIPATPTIKVSIGLIEVRAITQQATPVKRIASPVPAVSLDEYLKKQSGEKK